MLLRIGPVLSRLSLVSVVAVSAAGLTACNRAQPAPTATAAESSTATSEHGPGHRVFRQIQALDLRADQRDAVAEVEQNLRAELAPHRETVRAVARSLATGIEMGSLDAEQTASQEALLIQALGDARISVTAALNGIHDVLDAGQRAELVAKLRAHRWNDRDHEQAHREGPMAKVALELGLSEQQKQELRDGLSRGLDEIFPDRKTRREAMEARMKALGDAFMSEDFDAADFDLMAGAEEHIKSFTEIAARVVDVSGTVLTDSQRLIAGEMIRARADRD